MRTTELEKCQAELSQTQVELGAATCAARRRKRDLEQRDEQIATLEGNARTLAKNLSATEREMDALRRAHAQSEQRSELYRTLVARLREAIGAGTLARRRSRRQDAGAAGRRDLVRPGAGGAEVGRDSARCDRWRRR